MGLPITESSNLGSPKLLSKNDSLHQKRQISLDPTSVFKEAADHHPSFVLPRLKPGNFLSNSLPNSATSSPRISSPLKKKWKNQSSTSQPSGQQSLALSRLAQLQETHFRRSKSCGEGRNTSPSVVDLEIGTRDINMTYHEKFKCGACLFLPGFGKVKPVTMSRRIHEEENIIVDDGTEMKMRKQLSNEKQQVILSTQNRVSLEKFECGSWTSSAIVMDNHEDAGGLLLDLQTEENRDNESTVSVFDGDLKGVLKKVVVRGSDGIHNKKAVESGSRHVRFSEMASKSNPGSPRILCISPQLRKARDDFNAFLEAQTA